MKNSFNITVGKFTLRSTDDYHVIAEIIREQEPVLQWYREEEGFTFQMFKMEIYANDEEEVKIFIKLFAILVEVVNSFMLEEGHSMRFSSDFLKGYPLLQAMCRVSGIEAVEDEEDFENLDFLQEDLDKMDGEEYDDPDLGHKDFED